MFAAVTSLSNYFLARPQAGSHSLTQSKTDWPASTNRAWNNICAFTEKLGKQHIGYANCLSQSIARSFTEHSKSSVAELNAIDVKVFLILLMIYAILKRHAHWSII